MFKMYLGAGAALALMTVSAQAEAQVLGSPSPASSGAAAPAAKAGEGSPADTPRVMLRQRRDGTYEAARPFSKEDDLSVMTMDGFNRLKQNEGKKPEDVQQEFVFIQGQNKSACGRATDLIVRIDSLAGRYKDIDVKYAGLYTRTFNLKSARVGGSWLRRLGGVVTVVAAYGISGPYGGVVAPGVIANEANATLSSDKAQDLNRDATLANIELSRTNVEHSLLTLDMDLIWVELVDNYCSTYYPPAKTTFSATASY